MVNNSRINKKLLERAVLNILKEIKTLLSREKESKNEI
jgi:hypothetical protein